MKAFYLLSFLFLLAPLTAQDLAMVEPAPAASTYDGPSLVYRDAPTTAGNSFHDFSLRRERTLFGDLDLSGAWGGPTYNYSATGDDWSLVRGGFGGLELGENVFIGYGGWASRDPFTTDEVPAQGTRPDYKFRHGGFILALSPGADNIIHPRFTMIVGPGRIEGDIEGESGEIAGFRERMLVGQAMAGAEINLFEWFRIGIEGGYRFASGVDVIDDAVTAQDISGAVVQIEARFGFSW